MCPKFTSMGNAARRLSPLAAIAVLALPIVTAAVEPDKIEPDKVYLEHADRLVKNDNTADETGEYQVLVGNVMMRKGAW